MNLTQVKRGKKQRSNKNRSAILMEHIFLFNSDDLRETEKFVKW